MSLTQKIFDLIGGLIGGELLQFVVIRFGTRLVHNPWGLVVVDALVVAAVFWVLRRKSLQAAFGMIVGTVLFVVTVFLFA